MRFVEGEDAVFVEGILVFETVTRIVEARRCLLWLVRDLVLVLGLGVVDRLIYDSYEPLTTLAAAAAVTSRVRLATTIVIGPLHNDTLLAKVTASLDALSGGRLVLGLAVGARKEDYDAAGIDYRSRGKRLTEQLASLRSLWEDASIGPETARSAGPELLVGGLSDQGFARVARYADGYVHGGGPPRTFARAADKARAAWSDAGRPGKPQLWAQGYFALGADAVEAGYDYMRRLPPAFSPVLKQ